MHVKNVFINFKINFSSIFNVFLKKTIDVFLQIRITLKPDTTLFIPLMVRIVP